MAETKTVLVADDETMLRQLIRATFRGRPLRILEAASGAETLLLARSERPHLVLLDVGLPEPDGYAVCAALKKDPVTAGIKVVMLTARAQRHDLERGAAAGADAYITKPFSPQRLLSDLDGFLRD
ncbi:MAG TPA: response regulator [Candidatus Methylomirabilis sp.]|nr:response regulator [Candidatus Methylomirabilis sp.]